MDYQKLAEVIEKTVDDRIEKSITHIRLGTVANVYEKKVDVTIDGSSSSVQIVKGCSCSVGDRVIVLRGGTQFYAIARIGGGT